MSKKEFISVIVIFLTLSILIFLLVITSLSLIESVIFNEYFGFWSTLLISTLPFITIIGIPLLTITSVICLIVVITDK